MRFWLALTGLLLFAAGASVGVAGARWTATSTPAHDLSQFLPFNEAYLENQDLLANLGLSEEQKKKLEELKDTNAKRIRDLREQMIATSQMVQQQIRDILTPEQRDRFEDLKEERERKRIEDRVRWDLARLGKDKDIPEDLRAQMFPLMVKAEIDKREVWKTCDKSDMEKVKTRIKTISEERDKEIAKILPANHFEDYKEWKQREKRRREGGRGKDGRRDGPPGGPPPGSPPGTNGKDPGKLPKAPQPTAPAPQ